MSVATRTYLAICEAVARNLGALEQGTLTTVTTASVVLPYPFKTALTNASTKKYVGDELYWTNGQFTPTAVGIITYAPSTGTLTPDYAWTDGGTDPTTFDLFKKGLRIADLKIAVNNALRNLRYVDRVPLTLCPDGDMEASSTLWVAVGAAVVAQASAWGTIYPLGNVYRGLKSLKITHDASGISGGAQSPPIRVQPGGAYYLQARVRCTAYADVATLMAYDSDNAASIDTETWQATGWGVIGFTFTAPSTCSAIRVRLNGNSATAITYWDDVILLPTGSQEIPLPDWLTDITDIRYLYGSQSWDDYDYNVDYPFNESQWDVIENAGHTEHPLRLVMTSVPSGPLWLEVSRPFPELSADTDTTWCPREWIETAATVEMLDMLVNKEPGEQTKAWKVELVRQIKELKILNAQHMPKRVLRRKPLRW